MSSETNLGNSSFKQAHKKIKMPFFDAFVKGYLLCSASKGTSVELCATTTNTFQSKRNWLSHGRIRVLMVLKQAITVRSPKKSNNGKM